MYRHRLYCFSFVLTYVAAAILTPILTAIPTRPAVSPNPTVTHSPVMMRGVNVAAAVAIPVVLVLLLLVIGVVVVGVSYYKFCQIKKGLLSVCLGALTPKAAYGSRFI